jgi:hypothetical protein
MDADRPIIFLSAGVSERIVPDGTFDDSPYVRTARPELIREAVLALVVVCHERGFRLVFGGHPAISPLVHHAADRLQMISDAAIYQSEFFLNQPDLVPEAAWKFPHLHRTPDKGNLDDSVAALRDEMISPLSHMYATSVYIGGKKGIPDEFSRFGRSFPGVSRLPLYSPGGAAQELFIGNHSLLSRTPLILDQAPFPQRPPYKELFRDCLPRA